MIDAKTVIQIYQFLSAHQIRIWLTGGWGIDALLGEQTRPHKDLDFILHLDQILRLRELMAPEGYSLKEIWSENKRAVDSTGSQTDTALVLQDSDGRELDLHAIIIDPHGNGIPAWEAPPDFIFSREDLSGQGLIHDFPVACISAESQIICHTGYELPDNHRRDLVRLQQKYGGSYPVEFATGDLD